MLQIARQPARVLSRRSRQRKAAYLRRVIPSGSSVLVVGVSGVAGLGTQSLVERELLGHCRVTGLTYEPMTSREFPARLVRADGRRLPFRDGAFDYVVSNAVIEHLGGPAGARALLSESGRVARTGWVHTTPNRRFPVETHTGVPVAHWLPTRPRSAVFRAVGIDFPPQRYWLFTRRSVARLAPAASVFSLDRVRPSMTLLVAGRGARPGRPA